MVIGALGPAAVHSATPLTLVFRQAAEPDGSALLAQPALTPQSYWNWTVTLRNPATPARTSRMFAYQKVQRSLRDERYKLIRYPQVDRTQLFDLVADPAERTDLSARPEHAARITAMTAALAVEMKRVDDPAELTVASPRPAAWSPPPARVKK
jgi:arylsulfatase A-like enzyme